MKEPYLTYGDNCLQGSCYTAKGLVCAASPTGCNCPNTFSNYYCDCPTTHYWDSSSSSCVTRVTEGGSCVNGKDYMCNYVINRVLFYFFFESVVRWSMGRTPKMTWIRIPLQTKFSSLPKTFLKIFIYEK